MASRYFSYQDFLLRKGESYANVLLIDPSTTVFQADPFAAPLPADIVYTAERRRIDDTPTVHDAVVQAYGEAVAHNIRDCTVSNADIVAGTRSGMLRYLAAMVHQLAGRTTPITGAIDQGVHNYVVHMRPLRGAWLDATDRIAVAVDTLPDDAMEIVARTVTDRWRCGAGVVPLGGQRKVDGVYCGVTAVQHGPIDAGRVARADGRTTTAGAAEPELPATDAVVAFYLRERDAAGSTFSWAACTASMMR